ncbi:C6 transcription factor [Aspergillus flavus]|uniref:C6 transcription factor n=1 Tax=Aspergillus flavus TaxID=5059 RepID=A0A5N6HCY7_ASPFL|nr:C6 transcription factor [Aspergillus flavus]KAJ1714670.1 Zn(II)2Cys6 transcription factor [Aspergillus flavus]KDE78295.1 C6 transcription factor, putative [Aspergillus oryzae 100-8]KOC13207.1 Zn(II)2Cys6 transcription factor [Aspergillus flavus AF70]
MEVRRQSRNGHATFQRTYKACLACRQRKAKCELGTGPDGLALGPPCAKCRREQRECVFSEKKAWERQKKRGQSEEGTPLPARARPRLSSNPGISRDESHHVLSHGPSPLSYAEQNQDNGDSTLQSSPTEGSQRRRQSTSTLANSMMRTVVSSGNDALNILFEAAAAHSKEHGNGLSESSTPSRNARSSTGRSNNYESSLNQSIVPPEVLAKAAQPVEVSQASKEVLSVWGACRFVRMGWFTAREAVTFIDLFFKNMSDLSPILTDFYADHNNHRWLVSHDPVLCCTILMISSRYHLLPGAGGGSRNFFIHHRLWQHCQQLVMRLMFGQEKSSQSKVRNIGTIEALMLMSEWHPRSLHFPPESDGWDFDLTSVPPEPQELEDSSSTNRWLEDMIEPARRSDQMSWMLLGSALSLAHELGIFELDEKKLGYASGYEGFISGEQIKLRRQRVQRLLYVYINQLAWRIGCVSLMPQSLNHAILGRRATKELNQTGDEWLIFMDSWMDLTKLAKSVTDMFFPTVSFARQQLHSGRYIELLDHFRPILDKWKEEHLQVRSFKKQYFDILFIEYHFVRVYTHSVGMQAVVERVLADSDPRAEEVRALNIDPIDYEYIQEVIDGCCQILQKVIQLAENGVLRFCPVRIFLRITSSSIFLMKALSLGTRQSTLRESLDVLERSIQALRSNALDDIHLSTRYAALLDMHVARLRRNLLASSKTVKSNQGTASRPSMGVSSSTDHGNNTPMMDISMSQNISDMGYIPSLNDIAADDWLSLPFDPSMAPFGISSAGQFPAYEGGALNFIWNLPS